MRGVRRGAWRACHDDSRRHEHVRPGRGRTPRPWWFREGTAMSNQSSTLLQRLEHVRIIPVVVLPSADDAIPLARALADGGLPCAEITFRSDAGREGIRRIATEFPDFLIGAGTVTTPEEAEAAKQAGAQFAVAPGCNAVVVRRAQAVGLPFLPGVMTPSDIENALMLDCTLLKFFPAEATG